MVDAPQEKKEVKPDGEAASKNDAAAKAKKKTPTTVAKEEAEGFFHANIYNESAGLKSGGIVAIIAAVGAAIMSGGSWLAKTLTGLVVGAVALLGSGYTGKAWDWAANKLGITNHDKTPSIEKLNPPKAKKPLEELPARVSGDETKHFVESPILKNLKIPEGKNLGNVMHEYQETVSKAILCASHATAQSQAELDGKFAELKSRAGELSDGLATWYEYEKKREEYMGKGGEREKLIDSITERMGGDAAARKYAEDKVPVLPPIEVDDPQHPGTKMRLSMQKLVPMSAEEEQRYSEAYKQSPEKKRYGNKEWADLDPFSKQIFGLNTEVEHVRTLRGDINTRFLNGRTSVFSGHQRLDPLNEDEVAFGAYGCWTPHTGVGTNYRQDNVSGAVNYYLQQDPFAQSTKPCLEGTGMTNLAQLKAYVQYQLSCYNDEQKKDDDIPWVGWAHDKTSYDTYTKILQYCESLEKLQARDIQVSQMSWVADKLQALGNSPAMVKAHDDAHSFVDQTLPKEINQTIEARAAEQERQRQEMLKRRQELAEEAAKGKPKPPHGKTAGPLQQVDATGHMIPATSGRKTETAAPAASK